MATTVSSKHTLARNGEPDQVDVKRSEGSYLVADSGRRYLDFMSGWCAGNLGWGSENIRNAIRDYSGPDYVPPAMIYRPWEELSDLLARLAPGKLTVSFRATGGSEAVDTAMQIAMAYTGRKKFVSVEDSYHGNTLGPLSIGASSTGKDIESTLANCMKIDAPLDERALKKLENRLKKKDVAAFIMEPVLINLAVHIPTREFMEGARRVCSRYGTLFIADEVASGFGRTGSIFACGHYEVEPDVMCLAKGLSGGYAAIGATMTTEKIYKKVKDKVKPYSTYGWHPVSVAAAIANVRQFARHGRRLMEQVGDASQHFRTRISQMEFRHGGQMSMIGLAIAVNVKKTSYAEEIRAACLDEGLIISTQDKHLVMFPPLTISQEEIDEGMDILEKAI